MQVLRLALLVLMQWCFSAVVQCLSLTVDRATSDTLLIDISCESCEGGSFLWEYKSSPDAPWSEPPRLYDHLFNSNAYYISGLREDSLHFLRVRHSSGEGYSNELQEWTCEKRPPSVKEFRVASAGPGWLDIRWTLPKEKCKSFYYYDIRYKPIDGLYTSTKRYGYFEVSKSKAYVKPSHPCSGKDFCVLLTDHVVAGQIHQIELQIERIGGDEEQSEKLLLTGIANTANTGPVDFKGCRDRKKNAKNSSNEETNQGSNLDEESETIPNRNEVVIPMWVAILLGIIIFLVLGTIVGLLINDRISSGGKAGDQNKFEEIALPPAEYMEERYVDPGNLMKSANWKNTSDNDNEIPIYEEINIHLSTHPDCSSSPVALPRKH